MYIVNIDVVIPYTHKYKHENLFYCTTSLFYSFNSILTYHRDKFGAQDGAIK